MIIPVHPEFGNLLLSYVVSVKTGPNNIQLFIIAKSIMSLKTIAAERLRSPPFEWPTTA